MTNQVIPSNNVAPLPQVAFDKPHPPKDPSKVTKVALPKIPKKEERSFFGGWGDRLVAFAITTALGKAKEWDDRILPSILTNKDDLTQVVEEIAPQLFEFISPLLPDEIKEIKNFLENKPEVRKELVDRLLIRIITNLSLSLYSDEVRQKIVNGENIPEEDKIPANELASKLFNKLVRLVGEDFNSIDEQVATHQEKLKSRLFRPTLENLYELIFPPGDIFRLGVIGEYFNIKESLVSKGAKGCRDLYRSLLKWINREEAAFPSSKSEEVPLDLTPLQAGIGKVVKYINGELRERWQEKDGALFEQLTGIGDITAFMEKISPEAYEQLSRFFPKELAKIFQEEENQKSLEETTKTFLLHAVASLAKEVFKKELEEGTQVAPEQLIERAVSHLAGKIRAQFEKAHQKEKAGEKVTEDDFAPISAEIIKIFLPEAGEDGEYQWMHDLMQRRQKELTEPLHHILLFFYHSQPAHGKVEEYKTRLKTVFRGASGSEAAVQQLYNLSSNLAALIRDQIASPLKDSQKVFEELDQDSPGFASRLSLGVEAVFQGNDSNVSWIQKQMQQTMEYMIFRGIVHLFEKVPSSAPPSPQQLLMQVVQRLLKIGMKHLPQITEDLELQKGRILLEVRSRLSNPEFSGYIEDKEKRKVAIEREVTKSLEASGAKLIQPFLDEFMGLFFENENEMLEDQIPFIGELNNPICQKVRLALAKQFSKMLVVTTSWMQDRKKNETRLEELYQSKNPMKLCNVLGHMAREGLSSTLREDNVSMTEETVMPFLKPYFCPVNDENADIDLTFLQNMLQGFFSLAGNSASPAIQKLMDFIGDFTETSLLRLMADFSKRFKTMEEVNADPPPFSPIIEESKKQWTANAPDKSLGRDGDFGANRKILRSLITNPEITDEQLFAFIKFAKIKSAGKFLKSLAYVFQKARGVSSSEFIDAHEIKNESMMEGLSLHLLEIVKDHFDVMGGIKKDKKNELTREKGIEALQRAGKLHPAVSEGQGKDDFFRKLSHQIFQVIGVNDKSYLPIPDFLKKSVWKLVEDKLVPLMLVQAIDAARKPSNLQKMIVAALQDSVDVVKKDEDSFLARLFPNEDELDQRLKNYAPRFNDAYQSKLEDRIGGVLDAVIQPRGKSIPRWLLNMKFNGKRIFHDKTATAIGQLFRAVFRKDDRPVSTLQLLNTAMGLMADSVVEVEWSERENKIVYPKTEFDGKKQVSEDGATLYVEKPNLAKFFPKTPQEKIMAEALEKSERKKAEKEVPYYLRKVISQEAKRFVKDKFLQSWDLFEAKFKERCPNLSKVIGPILTFLVKLPILVTVVFFLDMCIWCIVNAVLKLVLTKQIEKYAQDTNVDVYDNVIYQTLDHGMDKIVEGMGQVYVEDEYSGEAEEEEEVESVP